MDQIAALHMLSYMTKPERVNIAITAGSSPKGMYETIIPQVRGKSYFSNVHYYNFDEIPYKKEDREGITIENLRKLYLTPAEIPAENIHILDQHNWEGYDKKLAADGGLDLVILGLGGDGHFCGNLPNSTKFGDLTTKVINNEYLQSRVELMFKGPNDAPNYYITMGPRTIMNIKNLMMIVSGKGKAEILKKVMEGPVDEAIPSSILKLHPSFTLILDADAASLLE